MTIHYNNSNYGTITCEGKEYHLQGEAVITGRQLPGPWNINDVSEGEEYQFEMSAPARDDAGNEYEVRWIFTDIKGEDGRELDSFDYGDEDLVTILGN